MPESGERNVIRPGGEPGQPLPEARVVACPVAFNEDRKIGQVLDRIPRDEVDAVWLVDDASTDDTYKQAQQRQVRVLRHEKRMGVGRAIRTALETAVAEGFDILVVIAGNNKDAPEQIGRLIKPIIEDGADLVQGSRYLPGGDFGAMPLYRQLATRFVHPLLFSLFSGQRMTDTTNGFRAIRLSILEDPLLRWQEPWLEQYELEPYLLYQSICLGYRVIEVPVTKIYPPKELGITKMKPIVGWWSILKPLFYLRLGLRS